MLFLISRTPLILTPAMKYMAKYLATFLKKKALSMITHMNARALNFPLVMMMSLM